MKIQYRLIFAGASTIIIYIFSEEVDYLSGTGQITFNNGTTQQVAGSVVAMRSGIQVKSGMLKNDSTPASAQYYISLTIRRQRVANSTFHLIIAPIQGEFVSGNVGSHILRVYNDSLNTLLQEQNLVFTEGASQVSGIFEISNLVPIADFIRVEIIAQLALTDNNSPQATVAGGSQCGLGFLDNVS